MRATKLPTYLKRVSGLAITAAALVAAPGAHASTYLFSLFPSQVQGYVQTAIGGANFGVYSFFIQPTTPGVSIVSASETSAKPGAGADEWTAQDFNDATNALGSINQDWMQFSINFGQSGVTLISNQAGYIGQTYTGSGAPPIAFGPTTASVDSETFPTSFTFELTSSSNLYTTPVAFTGYASFLYSSGGFLKSDTKVPFSFQMTAVPEPGTLLMLLFGSGALFTIRRIRS